MPDLTVLARCWNLQSNLGTSVVLLDELELMKVFDDVLKFVVQHGGKDKRQERLHLLKGLCNTNVSDPAVFISELIESSLNFLCSAQALFDPVTGHFLPRQRSISSTIEFYLAETKWKRFSIVPTLDRISSFKITSKKLKIYPLKPMKLMNLFSFVIPQSSMSFKVVYLLDWPPHGTSKRFLEPDKPTKFNWKPFKVHFHVYAQISSVPFRSPS